MDRRPLGDVLRRLVGAERPAELTDAHLLERFTAGGDEDAFAALVRRHAPMVLGVCRRVLHDDHEAEDACQVTFLVLARKAGSVRKRGSAASWLYGVALRVAGKVRTSALRRQAREARAAEAPKPAANAEAMWRELQVLLDEELRRLPESYRAPLVLCYLEGLSQEEAAQQLGWGRIVLKGRLARGKEVLRKRLARRGLALPVGLFIPVLAPEVVRAAVSVSLQESTVQAAGRLASNASLQGLVSPQAQSLLEGVLRAMFISKLKIAAGVVLPLLLLVGGVGLMSSEAAPLADPPHSEAAADPAVPVKAPPKKTPIKPERTTLEHEAAVQAVAYHPDGKRLATGDQGGQVWLWDLATRKATSLPKKHATRVHSIAISPNGSLLASGDAYYTGLPPEPSSTIHVWDLAKPQLIRTVTADSAVKHLTFSPSSEALAFLDHGQKGRNVRVWDIAADKEKTRLALEEAELWIGFRLAYSPDGRFLAVAGARSVPGGKASLQGEIKLFDLSGRLEPRRLQCDLVECYGMAYSPDGRFLATTGWQVPEEGKVVPGPIELWEMTTLRRVAVFRGHTASGWAMSFAADGVTFASGAGDQTARVWRVGCAQEPTVLKTGIQGVPYVAFAPKGQSLVVGGNSKTVQLWNVAAAPSAAPEKLKEEQLQDAWKALGHSDPAVAYVAVAKLAASPEQAVALLRSVKPAVAADAAAIRRLLTDLQSEQFAVRDRAARDLEKLDEQARPALEEVLAGQPALDIRKRVEHLLARLDTQPAAETLRGLRAITVLQIVGDADSRKLLKDWAGGDPGARLSRAAAMGLSCLDRGTVK